MTPRKSNRHAKKSSLGILLGLVIGSVIGISLNHFGLSETPFIRGLILNFSDPMGDLFLNGLKMLVVPLVVASLIGGVSRLGSVRHMGSMGKRLAIFYLLTSLIAVVIGQLLVSVISPGEGLPQEMVSQAQTEYADKVADLQKKASGAKQSLWPGLVTTLVPSNIITASASPSPNMIALIVFSLLFGSALLTIPKEKSAVVQNFASSIEDVVVVLISWIMKLAPLAVGCLMVGVMARFGLELLQKLTFYILTVVLGYAIHFFVTYQWFVRRVLKYPFRTFLSKVTPILATAFSTSSSAATMPTTIQVTESEFGVKKETASFAISLGATVNMDGTALFECVAVLFIAQIFGVDLSALQQIQLVIMVFLTSVGVAGIPGGSIPMIMAILAMFGIPPTGIALVLGVDRLLDMGRTLVNVTGDVCGTLYLAKADGQTLLRESRAT